MYQKQELIAAPKQSLVGLPHFYWNWLVYFLLNDVVYLPCLTLVLTFTFKTYKYRVNYTYRGDPVMNFDVQHWKGMSQGPDVTNPQQKKSK